MRDDAPESESDEQASGVRDPDGLGRERRSDGPTPRGRGESDGPTPRDRGESDGPTPRSRGRSDGPAPESGGGAGGSGWRIYVFDLLSSVGIVFLIGALLFTASGIWPPMVAVESGSMEPVLEKGDLVYVMEADRFPGPGANEETGVVTARTGRENGYRTFDGYGDVIVFQPDGNEQKTPVIHRAMFWVEEGENWLDKADPSYLPENASCEEDSRTKIENCPAPYAGFITKGDANGGYDQVNGIAKAGPIKPGWIVGTAELSVPYLGSIRLNAQAGATNTTAG